MEIKEYVGETLTDRKFDKLMVAFLLDEPFFASIIMNLKKVKTYDIPTAGVTVRNNSFVLYWNPDFVSKLPKIKLFGLMKHECYHLIYQHVVARKQDPHTLWNIATDLAINSLISQRYLPDGGLVPGKRLKKETSKGMTKEGIDRHDKMSNFLAGLPMYKSSEWYMEKLKDDKEASDAFESAFGDAAGVGFDVHLDRDGSLSESDMKIMKGKLKDIIRKSASERSKKLKSRELLEELIENILMFIQAQKLKEQLV